MINRPTRRSAGLLPMTLAGVFLLAGAAAHAQTAHPPSAGLRLMPLGDSITAGYRSTTGDGYRGPLWKKLTEQGNAVDFVGSQRGGAMLDSDNEGYYGAKIDEVAKLVPGELALYQPNVILLHLGSNDLNGNYEVATAPKRLAALIDQIIAADPKADLLVAQLICDSNADVQARIEAYNAQIPGIVEARAKAGKHIYLVSMSSVTPADLNDGLHPSDTGYQKMADTWDASIHKLIAAKAIPPISFAGSFEIQSAASGQAVAVSGGSTTNAAAVIQEPYSGAPSQLWNFIPTSGGYYQIKNMKSALDLNVAAVSKASGAAVVQWPFGTEGNDQWLPKRRAGGSYVFQNRNSGLLLDNSGGKTAQAPFSQADPSGKSSQTFKLLSR